MNDYDPHSRATISELADLGRRGAPGRGGQGPRRGHAARPEWTLAALAGLLVVVVAFGVLGRFVKSAPPVAPAPFGPITTAAPPTPGETPPASPMIGFPETLPVVMTGEALSVAGWAPDGSSFAVVEHSKSTNDARVHLFGLAGTPEGVIWAESFGWIDAQSFVILRGSAAYFGRVGSVETAELPGTYDWLVAGFGRVALRLAGKGTQVETPQYLVVDSSGVSEARDGDPAVWSRDGTYLAVVHHGPSRGIGDFAQGPAGWLEVVSAAGKSMVSAHGVEIVGSQLAFSPDGTLLAFADDTTPESEQIGILDVASGRVEDIATLGPFAWANSGQLLFYADPSQVSGEKRSLQSWSAATDAVALYGTGTVVGASGKGIVITDGTGPGTLTLTDRDDGSVSNFSVAAGPYGGIPDAAWSPDGHSLVLISGEEGLTFMNAVMIQH